jgi:competence protein ComEA
MYKIVLSLAGALLLGGGAGWYGLTSSRASEPIVPAVNREMEQLLAQALEPRSSSAAPPSHAAPAPAERSLSSPAPSNAEPSLEAASPSFQSAQPSNPAHTTSAPTTPLPPSLPPEAVAPSASQSAAIDLNKATLEQLLTLPGIGESKGKAILELRSRLGAFRTVGQLKDVKGIGDKTMGKLRPLVRVGGS